MASTPFDTDGEARAALAQIVADPQYGPDTLANARALSNLLKDLLPASPREAAVLVAAADADVVASLRRNLSGGMSADTACSLASVLLADRKALAPQACDWAVHSLAEALGHVTSGASSDTTAVPADQPAVITAVPADQAAAKSAVHADQAAVSERGAQAAVAGPPARRTETVSGWSGRLGLGDVIAGAATTALLISLFLPWYSANARYIHSVANVPSSVLARAEALASAICGPNGCGQRQVLVIRPLGAGGGGWRFSILAVAALLVLYLLAHAVLASRTPREMRHWQVLTAGAVVLAALVVLAFLANPFSFLAAYGVTVSASFGAYLALVAAAAAVVGGIISRPPRT